MGMDDECIVICRFENAVTAAEKAAQIDPRNAEVAVLLTNVRLVARARARGNDLFKSERFTEACLAYEEGLKLEPSNSVLYCNRAACFFKLGLWERSIEDCNRALSIQPNYTKALLRRAASNSKVIGSTLLFNLLPLVFLEFVWYTPLVIVDYSWRCGPML